MKKKQVLALLMAVSLAAASPCVAMVDGMVVYAEEGDTTTIDNNAQDSTVEKVASNEYMATNAGTVTENAGTICSNSGTIGTNDSGATVKSNSGNIVSNAGNIDCTSGSVGENSGDGIIEGLRNGSETYPYLTGDGIRNAMGGTIATNSGDIVENNATVATNTSTGEIWVNFGTVTENKGTIDTNRTTVTENASGATVVNNYSTGYVQNNEGTVTTNAGTVSQNNGYIDVNNGTVYDNQTGSVADPTAVGIRENNGTVDYNYVTISGGTGTVKVNGTTGTVTVTSLSQVGTNYGTVIMDGTKYYGVSGSNSSSTSMVSLANIAEGQTYTLSLPSGYTVSGNIVCALQPVREEGDEAEATEGGYIVRIGDTFTISGPTKFVALWTKIIQEQGGNVVVEETKSEEEEVVVTPAAPSISVSGIDGVTIYNISDVAKVISTMSDKIEVNPVTNTKDLSLDFTSYSDQGSVVISDNIITSLASSDVDTFSCKLTADTSITFTNDASLANYIPTDFAMKANESESMKTLNFNAEQNIGMSVTVSTTVPVANKQVGIWQLVNGQYKLIGIVLADANGNIAFPISTTGNIALTY